MHLPQSTELEGTREFSPTSLFAGEETDSQGGEMTLSKHFLKKMCFSRIIIFRTGNYANWYVWLNLQAFKEKNMKNNNVFSWEGRSDCMVSIP